MKIFALYQGLPRSIYALFFAQIVNAMGHFVFPFLTLFLTQKLGYDSGVAGTMILLASTAFVPGSLIGGRLADKIGRKSVLITAQGLAAVALIPCAFLGTSPVIPWLIILSHMFSGAANPCHEAVTADITRSEQRKAAYSLLYLGHNIGFSVGPLIAGYLFTRSLPLLFLGDVATTFIALILVGIMVKESRPSEETIEESKTLSSDERAEEGSFFKVLLSRPFLLIFSVISLILSFVYAQFTFSLPLQLEEVFPEKGAIFYGTLMTVNALVVIFLTTIMLSLTRKIASLLTIVIAASLFAVGFGMIALIEVLPLFILSTVIWTTGEILQATNTNVYIANHTPISHRGRFNAILPIIMGAGFALGPMVMGWFIEENGVTAVWPLMFLLSLIAGTALLILYLVEKRRTAAKHCSAEHSGDS